ncbi:MAG: hypothetical protein J0H05_11380 [Stenotrophomonas acidaminiphila]|mgnify:CR=1 FL=1|nr:hypothetical protein [Stenotrophomonas acidaminiphila]OJY77725.1 MAG: hypothetical protein BGP18_05715 [Stenotrophomonas sp. 69-14]
MTMQPNNKCTCPSGDGSLRWPCPVHPAASAHEAVAWMTRKALDRFAEHRAGNADAAASSYAYAMPDDDCFVPLYAAPVTAAPAEMSPEFTDTARAAIAWVLWHHQGASSPVGQPLRFALGMGADEPLPDWRIAEAKRYAEWAGATTAEFHKAHASTPAAPGIDLSKVPRYVLAHDIYVSEMRKSERGAWVRLRDVESALIDASPKGATLNEQFGSAEGLDSPKGALNEQFGSAEGLSSPEGGSEADDAALLNWMDANGFTAYRSVDPIDGISGHCVVVHETMAPRRGNVHDTIRGAIRAAMKAQAGDAEVQP